MSGPKYVLWSFGGRLGRGGVDGAEILGELVPVDSAGVTDSVADQVQHAGLHDRPRPDVGDRVRRTDPAVRSRVWHAYKFDDE